MSWQQWRNALRATPEQAVHDLLRGAADISPFERIAAHEFLLEILPRQSRSVVRSEPLVGEPDFDPVAVDPQADLAGYLDTGLNAWLLTQREQALPNARKLSAYSAQVCEALQWPLYFTLPQTLQTLRAKRSAWLSWLGKLTISAYREPEYDYWQVLAAHQTNNDLQVFWHSFVTEAGRTRSLRYRNMGLLALAQLPLSEDDSLRNPRLQVQALVNRYQRRRMLGVAAQEELATTLLSVMARNPSMSEDHYREFLLDLLTPLGGDVTLSVLQMMGLLNQQLMRRNVHDLASGNYALPPPGEAEEANQVVAAIKQSNSLLQAWEGVLGMYPLLSAHAAFVHSSGNAYNFVRTLDKCSRALCEKYELRDPSIQGQLLQWVQLALRMEPDEPRRWMLWELVLQKAGFPERAQSVLWEMTRRFPEQVPCRVELARLLAASKSPKDQHQAQHLLKQVLKLDAEHLHAYSTLAKIAIQQEDWQQALHYSSQGLQIDPEHGPCALLLAAAYEHRGQHGDIPSAIAHLQRFTERYPGNSKAESYLRNLNSYQLPDKDQYTIFTNNKTQDSALSDTDVPSTETDPAWIAFAASVRPLATSNSNTAINTAPSTQEAARQPITATQMLLPLHKALQQAVANEQWHTDVLQPYDAATQQEFPLEVRLWRYLQLLQADIASQGELKTARESVQDWLKREKRQGDNPFRIDYLDKNWEKLNADTDTALRDGTQWLNALLDSYQPLPAPLLTESAILSTV